MTYVREYVKDDAPALLTIRDVLVPGATAKRMMVQSAEMASFHPIFLPSE